MGGRRLLGGGMSGRVRQRSGWRSRKCEMVSALKLLGSVFEK
jgi:hypothetical protein